MAQNAIKWSKNAEIDLFETLQFYIERNKNAKYSQLILKNVTEITNHLYKNPFHGRPHEIDGLRVLVIMDYNIYYKILENEFEIVHFWDTRRDSNQLELSLKKISF